MKDFLQALLDTLQYLWRFTSAFVALVLIGAAFAIGFWVKGAAAPTAAAPSGTTPTTQPAETPVDAKPTEYTCAMHPQVRSTDPDGKCPICFMDLVAVDSGGSEGERELVMTEASIKLAEIQTAPVVRMFPTRTIRMYGTIDHDETRMATIGAYFPGRLEHLFVDYTGVRVEAGDHLATIYSPELITTHAELRQALAAVSDDRTASETLRNLDKATLEAARERLRLWGLTPEQVRDLEETEDPMEQLTIYSPIAGVVIQKKAVEGMYVKTGDEIYRVADLSHLWIHLEAYESQMPWLRYGQDVEFRTDSHPGEVFHGRISFMDPVLNRATRTVRIRLHVDNTDGRLKPGMFVRARALSRIASGRLLADESLAGKWIGPMHPEIIKDGPGDCDICGMPLVAIEELGYVTDMEDLQPPLVIPVSAALVTGRRAVVYVRVPDTDKPTFEGREVVLGARADDLYIVQEGLRENEAVVINGAFKIDSAMQILAKPSMMDPKGDGGMAGHQHGDMEMPRRDESPSSPLPPVSEAFLQRLQPLFAAYFAAQEALAADDLDAFRQAAAGLHRVIAEMDTSEIDGETQDRWRTLSGELTTDAEHIEHLADLDAARRLFEVYSTAIIKVSEEFGHVGEQSHFVTYCFMGFGDRGAEWLALTDEINNPYLGEYMLRCGEIRREIDPRDHAVNEGEGR